MRNHLRRILRTKSALFALVVLLGADAFCMARRCFDDPYLTSFTGDLLSGPFQPTRRISFWFPWSMIVEMPDGSLAALTDYDESKIKVAGAIRASIGSGEWGVHAPIVSWFSMDLREHAEPGYQLMDIQTFRDPWAKQHLSHLITRKELTEADIRRLFATGSLTKRRILPLGILHDAITLTTLFLLIWSFRLNLARWREARRLRASQCPHCRYSILGLPTSTCPECGHEFANGMTHPT